MRIVHILWLAITLLIAPAAYAADANQDDFLNQMMNLPALAPEDITPPTENLQPDTTQQQTTSPSSAPVIPIPPSIPPSMPTVPDMPALPTMPAPPSSAPLSTPTQTPPPASAPAPMPVPVTPPSIPALPDMPTLPTMPAPPALPSNPDAAPSEPVQSQSLPTPTPIPPVLTPDIPQTLPVVPNNPELPVSPTPPMAPISTPEPVTPPIPEAIPTTPDMSEPLAIPSLPPETPSIPTPPEAAPPAPEAIPMPTPPMAPVSTPDAAPTMPPAPLDASTNAPVTPPAPEQADTPSEENLSDGDAIAMPDELPKDDNDIKETKPFSWTGSVMFDINNSRLLRQALEALDRGYFVSNPNDPSGAPTLAEQAADAPPKPPMRYTSPSFFLNTLLYLSPENWAVWLNGKKYTHTLPDGDLTIMSVMENRVTIQLIAPAPIDILSPKWKTTLTARTEEGHYASDDGRIIVNPKNNSITFTLKPNQSFSVYAMRIVEGRVRDTSFTR